MGSGGSCHYCQRYNCVCPEQTDTPEPQETRQEPVSEFDRLKAQKDSMLLRQGICSAKTPCRILTTESATWCDPCRHREGMDREGVEALMRETHAAQPHPETPQGDGYSMDEAEKARWASFRTEATAAARKLRDIDRAHVDGKMDESIHDGLLEAADLLDIFGRPIVVMTASQPPPEALTLAALKNVGIDTACGACMEVAFTGVTTNAHTCKSEPREPHAALIAEIDEATVMLEACLNNDRGQVTVEKNVLRVPYFALLRCREALKGQQA